MAKIKPIAVCFADIHYNNWANFNKDGKRLSYSSKAFRVIIDEADKYNIPVLFAGDLVDNPKHVDNHVLLTIKKDLTYARRRKIKIYAIGGNHDMCDKNFRDQESPSYIQSFGESYPGTFFNCDFTVHETDYFAIMGIPYVTGNKDYPNLVKEAYKKRKKDAINILMVHTDLPGAKGMDGREVDSDENIDTNLEKYFKGWDLVISGHIHRPQQLGKFIYMLGATNQQRRSDMGCNMGYWILYDNLSMEFVDLRLPEFKYYTDDEQIDDYHYWIKLPEEVKSGETVITGQFNSQANRTDLIKSYLETINEKSKAKRNLLIKLLND